MVVSKELDGVLYGNVVVEEFEYRKTIASSSSIRVRRRATCSIPNFNN